MKKFILIGLVMFLTSQVKCFAAKDSLPPPETRGTVIDSVETQSVECAFNRAVYEFVTAGYETADIQVADISPGRLEAGIPMRRFYLEEFKNRQIRMGYPSRINDPPFANNMSITCNNTSVQTPPANKLRLWQRKY